MRVPDFVVKSVCFIAEEIRSDSAAVEYDHWTTGFFVCMRSVHSQWSHYNVVTARHIAMIQEEPIQVDSGFAEVVLVEARSIGGLSGSPDS